MSNEAPADALRLVPVEPTDEMVTAMLNAPILEGDHSGANVASLYAAALAAAPASPLPGGGWRTDFENAPKDGRWIVTVDKWKNVEAMRWSKEVSRFNPEQGERGWIAKNGYPPNTRPELCVEWSELPAAPTGAK